MLIGGSNEFKSMMHQFYPMIYKDVVRFWWEQYVEKGMLSHPPDVALVDFGLRHIGELFRTNEFVADLNNGCVARLWVGLSWLRVRIDGGVAVGGGDREKMLP
jgi:hypothetical protein